MSNSQDSATLRTLAARTGLSFPEGALVGLGYDRDKTPVRKEALLAYIAPIVAAQQEAIVAYKAAVKALYARSDDYVNLRDLPSPYTADSTAEHLLEDVLALGAMTTADTLYIPLSVISAAHAVQRAVAYWNTYRF